ncbi:uncharacterized protein LOC117342579 [Pecten maximus]|uniref:uncharacterized protein LOC117342579 n=1 Tax=Pecten maximus TaxID=6579 RepID=UPI0014586945|nr:uncharacterized protein LOC117342579 [Pecten maximus]
MTQYKQVQIAEGKGTILIYLQCYFVTIATILGTGILGLPVTLNEAGLYPFLISFLIGACMQAVLIYFFTELLQLAHATQQQIGKEELVPLNDLTDDAGYLASDEDQESGEILYDEDDKIIERKSTKRQKGALSSEDGVRPPNLHLLGELFLGCGWRQMFDIILVLQFIALLISYALAGSEAYAELIGVEHVYVIPVFVWVLTLAIVFALKFIQPVVSVFTFFKGSLLLGTVIVTFYVGAEVNREIHNDFSAVGAPFLMGTVALGGVINTMPLMYSKISPVTNQVKYFRLAVILGLVTCTVLNVLWCWAVLDIVPQLAVSPCSINRTLSVQQQRGDQSQICENSISLEGSAAVGEISTIPLTKIIEENYPSFYYVAILVEVFIVVSITVSFLTIGAVLHHTLQGWVDSVWARKRPSGGTKTVTGCCNQHFWCHSFLSLAMFGIVFTVAMMDPQGFVDILEKFSSFTVNLEAGVFVFLMLLRARRKDNKRYLKIPLPVPNSVRWLQFLIPLYFGFAVIYDLYNSVRDIVAGRGGQSYILQTAVFNQSQTTMLPYINTSLTLLLQGWVDSVWARKRPSGGTKTVTGCCNQHFWCHSFLSLAMFGIVFTVAMMDPQGFVDILEKFSSFTVNLEAGVFVFLMLLRARRKDNKRYLKIPLPVPSSVRWLQFLIPLYFGFAVIYDLYNSVRDIVAGRGGQSYILQTAVSNQSQTTTLPYINTSLTLL